jgi:hypothetical protein
MRYSTVCAAFFAAVAAGSDVEQLNKDTFKSFVEENDLVLAECKLPKPPYVSHIYCRANMFQSLHHGAATARPSRLSTRRLPRR